MSCYHPFLAIPDYDDRTTRYKLVGPFEPDLVRVYPGSIPVPCGKCVGCRLDYSRNWADRMMLELDHTGKALFATLTYSDDNVPKLFDEYDNCLGLTLRKKDLQDFMKRLRGRKKFENTEIRFYGSGEYGSKTKRPHYHLVLFGINLDDFPDYKPKFMNNFFQSLYTSEEFEDIWQNGFILLGEVSWKTCAYVSRYVMKKATNELLPFPEAEPEFSLMSRNPGLGSYYLKDHDIDFEALNVKTINNGQQIKMPKFFINRLENIDPVLYSKVIEDRKALAHDATLRKLHNTDLTYQQMLRNEEIEVLQRTKKMQRSSV